MDSETLVRGIDSLALTHDFAGEKDLAYPQDQSRQILCEAASSASIDSRAHADLLAALMSDGAIKSEKKTTVIQPTPLCLQFGQGHQHFLERLANVPRNNEILVRGQGKKKQKVEPAVCLLEALFDPWHRQDPTPSFRWDPEEDVRYALMPGNPTDPGMRA